MWAPRAEAHPVGGGTSGTLPRALHAVPGLSGRLTAEFELGFVGPKGIEVRASLLDSGDVRFEQVEAVRGSLSYKRQRHFPGLWWFSTVGGHVGYESWLERAHPTDRGRRFELPLFEVLDRLIGESAT